MWPILCARTCCVTHSLLLAERIVLLGNPSHKGQEVLTVFAWVVLENRPDDDLVCRASRCEGVTVSWWWMSWAWGIMAVMPWGGTL